MHPCMRPCTCLCISCILTFSIGSYTSSSGINKSFNSFKKQKTRFNSWIRRVQTFPFSSMACASSSIIELFYNQVQRALGCSRNPLAYDITAACSGFMLGLVSAACHVRGSDFDFFTQVKFHYPLLLQKIIIFSNCRWWV